MKKTLALLALATAIGCQEKPRPSAEPTSAAPADTTQVDTLTQYEKLGTAPQADTGTAIDELPFDSTSPNLMAAERRPQRNKKPYANYTVGCTDLKCVFRSISKDPDGSIVKTLWSFPNGDAYNVLQVTRTYQSAGSYRFSLTVVDNQNASDDTTGTVKVTGTADTTITPPPPDTTQPPAPDTTLRRGKPFGAYSLLDAASLSPFNVVVVGIPAKSVVSRIDDARARGYKLVAAIPAMSHNANRLSEACCIRKGSDGLIHFYRKGYDSVMATYNTATIKAAIQKAYSDGVLVGMNGMDEPWVKGLGDGNVWEQDGSKTPMTKARVDSLCAIHKKLFPGVPVGTSTSHRHWAEGDFKVCDIGLEQFSYRYVAPSLDGSIANWIKNAEALANRAGIKTIYSFNPVNGGTPDASPTTWDCSREGGVKGQRSPLCAMTGTQIVDFVKASAAYGCGANIYWRWDAQNNYISGIKSGFQTAATYLLGQNYRLCRPRP